MPLVSRYVLALCLSLLVLGCKEEEPTIVVMLEEHTSQVDAALTAFREGNFEAFKELFKPGWSSGYALSRRFLRASVEAHERGECTDLAILTYARHVTDYIEPMANLHLGRHEMGYDQRLSIAQKLGQIERARDNDLVLMDYPKAVRGCGSTFPGFMARIEAVEQFLFENVGTFTADFERFVGLTPVAVIDRDRNAARVHSLSPSNVNNWSSLSDGDKRSYTGGAREVENCISAFVGSGGVPVSVSTEEVASLCRNTLR